MTPPLSCFPSLLTQGLFLSIQRQNLNHSAYRSHPIKVDNMKFSILEILYTKVLDCLCQGVSLTSCYVNIKIIGLEL